MQFHGRFYLCFFGTINKKMVTVIYLLCNSLFCFLNLSTFPIIILKQVCPEHRVQDQDEKMKKRIYMPGYRAHLMGGFASYALLLFSLQTLTPTPLTMFEWLGCALIGSLFPDLDIKSKGQIWFYRLFFVVITLLIIQQRFMLVAFLSVLCITPLLVKHRGLFHRPWFVVGMPLCGVFLTGAYMPGHTSLFFFDALFFIAGAVSHILLDRGVRAFF